MPTPTFDRRHGIPDDIAQAQRRVVSREIGEGMRSCRCLHVRVGGGRAAVSLKLSCLLPLATMAACEHAASPGATVTDSAGVRLTVSEEAGLVFAELDSVPEISLGGPDATGPTEFSRIQGVHVDREGRLWVADGQSGELRIFEPDGSWWKTRGGRGEGPGEFVRIRLLGAAPGDTVLLADGAIDRLTVFSPDGEFVRTEPVPSSDRPAPRLFDVFGDGSALGQLPRIVPAASLEGGQVLTDSVELVRVTLGTAANRAYGSAEGPLWIWTGRNQVPIAFTTSASFAAAGDRAYLVAGPDFRIRVIDGGGLREVFAVDRAPRPVGRADLESYRAFVREYVPEPMRPDHLSAMDHDLRPDVLPAYDRVLVSADGHVWAQIYEPEIAAPHDWDVFDAEGRFLGQVRVWTGLYPMVITDRAVVGVWRDSLGVEHVRAYRFNRRIDPDAGV